MGMYFNTPATITLMQTLNTRYGTSANGLAANRTNDLNYLNAPHSLQQLWNTFGVSLGNPGNTNLTNWLTASTNIDNGLKLSVHDAIRLALIAYLGDNSCIAIEWFAVPSKQVIAHFPPHIPDPSTGLYSHAITIETLTVDKVASYVRETKMKEKQE
jgi:hypothetical protein